MTLMGIRVILCSGARPNAKICVSSTHSPIAKNRSGPPNRFKVFVLVIKTKSQWRPFVFISSTPGRSIFGEIVYVLARLPIWVLEPLNLTFCQFAPLSSYLRPRNVISNAEVERDIWAWASLSAGVASVIFPFA